VVEVRPAIERLSDRSPLAGIARRRFGGKTLLEWVVRRASEAERLDQIIVLAGDDALSQKLAENCPLDALVVYSSQSDPLGQLADCVRQASCDGVVRMNVSHPFIDPVLIDRLVIAAEAENKCDYAAYCFGDGRLAMQAKVGVFAEWCHPAAIVRANAKATAADDRRTATGYVAANPKRFIHKLLPAPAQLNRDDLRLAICDEEDWEHVQIILDALGPESLDWQYIAALLDRQPIIRQRMLDLNRAETAIV
jgi:spore coat polysaccharide biosynthesis protein SpsF (cytidylyltransferase family)